MATGNGCLFRVRNRRLTTSRLGSVCCRRVARIGGVVATVMVVDDGAGAAPGRLREKRLGEIAFT